MVQEPGHSPWGDDRGILTNREQDRSQLLAQIGRLLGHSLDYESTVREAADLAATSIADWCAVDLLQEDGGLRRVAVAHRDPAQVQLAYELYERYPPDPEAPIGLYAVLRSGEPELYGEITDEIIVARAQDEEQLRILRALELRSLLTVPLIARERVIGALTLAAAGPGRPFTEQDVGVAGELAQLIALAVDNALLYRQLTESNQQLEQRVTRRTEQLARQIARLQETDAALRRESAFVRLLQEVAVAANEAGSVEDALSFALEAICEHTGWPVGHVFLPDPADPDRLYSTNLWYVTPPGAYETFRRVTEAIPFTPDAGLPGRVYSSKKPAWISDVAADEQFLRARQGEDIGLRSAFAFPVLVGQDVAAVLEFFSPARAEPDPAFLEVVANIGTTLGRVAERERWAQAVHERSEQLAQAQRVARLGSWDWDVRSGKITWSEEMYRIVGAAPYSFEPSFEEGLKYFHPDDRDRVLQVLREQAMTERKPYELYYRIVRPDGSVRHIHSRSHPQVDETGAMVRLTGTWQDVTELKQAEETNRALLALSHRLNATLDLDEVLETLVAEAIRLTDAEGGCTGLTVDGEFVMDTYYYKGKSYALPRRWPPGHGIPGWVLAHRAPYVTADAQNDPVGTPDMIQRFGLRSILAAPVIDSQGHVLAFFEVADKRGQAGFDEEDRTKLVGLSQIAAIAIKNAQLYERQRLLSRQIVNAQEEERQRLSRELHDSIGQLLTALGIQLDMLGSRPEAAAVAQDLREAATLTHQIHDEIRAISHALRPPTLELTGLDETLRALSSDFARRTGLQIAYQGTELPRLPDGPSITFYRFLQETLANIARHAQAQHVDVTLRYDEGELSLTVRDDGVGFTVGSHLAPGVSHGVGLLGLRERFELLEGEMELESQPGAGTQVVGRCRVVEREQ